MINTFKILSISLMTAFSTFAFQQDKSKMLMGEWKVQEVTAEYPATTPAADKMRSEMDFDKFANRFKSSPFIFGKDSVLSVMGMDAHWTLEKDNLHIRIILMQNEELMATIISLDSHQLKFSVIDHDTKELFTLIKIK